MNNNSSIFSLGFFLLLLSAVPLLYSNTILDNALLPKFIGLSAVVALFSFLAALKIKEGAYVRTEDLLLIGFTAFSILSALNAFNLVEYFFELLKILLSVAGFYLVVFVLQKEKEGITVLPKLAVFSTLVALFFSMEEMAQALKAREPLSSTVYLIEGLHAHKNLLSNWVCLLIPFTFLGLKLPSNWPKIIFKICLIVQIGFVLFLQTRASILGLLAFVFVLLISKLFEKKGLRILVHGIRMIGILMALLIILLLLSPLLENWLLGVTVSSSSANERLILWGKTLPIIKEHWLSGTGLGNWKIYFPEQGLEGLYRATFNNTIFARPHNDFLWLMAETGIISFLLYIGFVGRIVYLSILTIDGSKKESSYLIVFVAAAIMYLVISFFDFPRERIEHTIVFAVILGALYSKIGNISKPIFPITSSMRRLSFLLSGLIGLTAIHVGMERKHSESALKLMFEQKEIGNHLQMKIHAEKAKNRFMLSDNNGIPIDWYLGLCEYNLGNVSDAHLYFESAAALHPYDFNVLNNVATTHFLAGRYENSIPIYLRALKINPHFDEMKLNLVSAFINIGDWNNAFLWVNQVETASDRSIKLKEMIQKNLSSS